MPKIDDDFIEKHSGYDQVMLQLFFNRGIKSRNEMENFLHPAAGDELLDPFLFSRMDEAVNLIIGNLKNGNKMVVYGDYDADGVTASVLLVETLKILKADVNVYIPYRMTEGYGLNKKAIDQLSVAETKLIITVDNGIRNKAEVQYCRDLGIDIIITDHHEPPVDKKDWPDCIIINPLTENNFPYNNFAGVGLSYKLAKALIIKAKLDEKTKKKLEDKILDLVAVGTIADCVSLLGENRALTAQGLEIINQGKRLGIAELVKTAQINSKADKKINAWNIGWQIAPRLNSAGRLDHANTAYELLITKNKSEAQEIAKKLNEKNSERQKITDQIFEYAKSQVNQEALKEKILIFLSPNLVDTGSGVVWPEGVIGLVAGRLSELYNLPALVITKVNEEIRGSGRSIDQFDIISAVEQAKQFLSRFGGHAQACGFTVKSVDEVIGFEKTLKKIAKEKLESMDLTPKIIVEAEIDLDQIDDNLLDNLERFEPYGEDNSRPKFLCRSALIKDKLSMGQNGQHVKFRFNGFWAVAFSQAETWKDLKIGDKIDLVYYLEYNQFNGKKNIQLKIVDIKKSCNT